MTVAKFKSGRDAVEALPAVIRVGLYDFRIQKWTAPESAGARRFGECSSCEQRIAIQLDMPSTVKAADTMIHEVEHAIWWAFGIEDEDKQERAVNLHATGLTTVFRDNPWLLDWLRRALA